MSYKEEFLEKTCNNCDCVNHILVVYAGDYRANKETETVECFNCKTLIYREKCWAIYAENSREEALFKLRKHQNRA